MGIKMNTNKKGEEKIKKRSKTESRKMGKCTLLFLFCN